MLTIISLAAEGVAALLNIWARTLHRLKGEGASLPALKDEVRCGLASYNP